ncbi:MULTISPECIES: DNA helicase Rep [unclassified Methylophaga]|uniref:DNA helicase Rep n=4 Tax=Methylophaga TaxID=40222 RepID=UPI000C4A0E2A|nr:MULTISPECIES: DNA helicase Rep [unclassified Methylophaga]MAL48474.1 DNA helicase Rep [Methylophaga sp.]MAP26038.1 DNA helicase Rep [Methylophaga sp.]MBP25683.1 DNA helicase Rep [Methylophaga sp.]MDX1749121.1 DNA helicase Rep [Methylophaga sp.]HAD29941.1 DNA helicase Rep [Methylophaga sp.]
MKDLNPEQREAVRYIDGPLLVLAGAGSGKTRVITRKIAYLIEQCGIKASNIAAVTFTNKAAREMKERVAELMSTRQASARGLMVSTFHTLGLNILRRDGKSLGYRPGFSIFDAQDSLAVFRDLMGRDFAADSDHAQEVQNLISNWKNQLILPEQAAQIADGAQEEFAARVYPRYVQALQAYNAVDFDDLILKPVILFREHRDVLQKWQAKIHYLLVDEYQDTNGCQYELVKQLVGIREKLTVVGDDDQSVYSWRGARPENLVQLQTDFPRLNLIKLEQNYRSMGRILRVANKLISHNPHVFEKRLWSAMGEGDAIRIIGCRDDEHESEKVISELLYHKLKHQASFKDYAILYRSNHQSRSLEKVLREHNVPYFLTGGTSFFSRVEVKDIMAYLRLLANQDDDNAFLRVINTPRRGIGSSTLQALGEYAAKRNTSMFGACFEMGLAESLPAKSVQNLEVFTRWLIDIADRAARGNLLDAIKDMIEEINYRGWLEEVSGDPNKANRRMENVDELVSWIERMIDQDTEEKSIGDIAARLTLMDIMDRQADENQSDAVHLMTLHAAKGLEFPHVFIVGMEEEILPHRTSIEEDSIEEERRLAYVGITRAQRSLVMTLANTRKRYGEKVDCEESRFLRELPPEDLIWMTEKTQVDPEERKERGKAHLSNIRDMLK